MTSLTSKAAIKIAITNKDAKALRTELDDLKGSRAAWIILQLLEFDRDNEIRNAIHGLLSEERADA